MTHTDDLKVERELQKIFEQISGGTLPLDEIVAQGRSAKRRRAVGLGGVGAAALTLAGLVLVFGTGIQDDGSEEVAADHSTFAPSPMRSETTPAVARLTCPDTVHSSVLNEAGAVGKATPIAAAEDSLRAGERATVVESNEKRALVVVNDDEGVVAELNLYQGGDGWLVDSATRCVQFSQSGGDQ